MSFTPTACLFYSIRMRFVLARTPCCWAHFARAKKQHRVLDLGTGTGILPLLMTALFHPKHITGIEIQPNMADMAQRSVGYNDLASSIDIVTGDYTKPQTLHAWGYTTWWYAIRPMESWGMVNAV